MLLWSLIVSADGPSERLSGVQLTRLIREFNISTPIVFYSGAAHEHDRHEALQRDLRAVSPVVQRTMV